MIEDSNLKVKFLDPILCGVYVMRKFIIKIFDRMVIPVL